MTNFTFLKRLGLFFAVCSWFTMVGQVENGVENYLYTPQFGNFDKLDKKGDMALQLASGGLVNVPFPSVRFSISPINRFGLGVNYFTFSNSNSRFDQQTTKAFVVSADIFQYGNLLSEKTKNFKYRIGLGYGQGKVRREYFSEGLSTLNGESNLGIQRYMLEGGAMFSTNNVGFGLGLRAKYYNFSDDSGFGDVSRIEIDRLDYLIKTAPVFLYDLNFRFEFGAELGRIFFSWDQTLNKIQDEDEILPGYLDKNSIHIGFYLILNKAINNKNKEK